jgi:hypothetical protein
VSRPRLCSRNLLFSDRNAFCLECAFCVDRDPYTTTKAGTFDFVDAVLPWRVEEPLPPPVPPKRDAKTRPAQAAATLPGRVTPWLLRRVKTPVTRATQVALSQKAPPSDVRAGGSPKPPPPPPPAYHAVPQQQIHPSAERLGIAPQSGNGIAITPASRPAAVLVPVVQPAVQVHPRTPPKPTVARRSARSGAQRGLTSHSSGSPQPSVRSAHEERVRPRAATPTPTPTPPRPAQLLPERTKLPSYHSAEPFPAPPPYRASAEDSYPTSNRSRSLPRSRKQGSAFEKEAPLPPLPSYPPLPSSAVSRIQAGYKVSKVFGDAVMRQEVRVAMPTPDHTRLDPAPTLRAGRRFMSTSEIQSFRKAQQHVDKSSPEHEVRHRTSSKPSSHVERSSGDSRQRTTSTNPERGRETKGVVRDRR